MIMAGKIMKSAALAGFAVLLIQAKADPHLGNDRAGGRRSRRLWGFPCCRRQPGRGPRVHEGQLDHGPGGRPNRDVPAHPGLGRRASEARLYPRYEGFGSSLPDRFAAILRSRVTDLSAAPWSPEYFSVPAGYQLLSKSGRASSAAEMPPHFGCIASPKLCAVLLEPAAQSRRPGRGRR